MEMLYRTKRLSKEIRKDISDIIQKEVKDPRVKGTIITDVELSNDLRIAKVYISVFEQERWTEVINGLNKSKGFIRKQLSRRIHVKSVPELRFHRDNSVNYGMHMDEVINRVLGNENKRDNQQ